MPPYPRYSNEEVVAALRRNNGLMYLTARDLGCAVKTLKDYIDREPEIAEAAEDELEMRLDKAEGVLDKAVSRGEPWAVCFFLKCRGKKRGYIERVFQVMEQEAHKPLVVGGEASVEKLK